MAARGIALFDYKGDAKLRQLSFSKGQLINITQQYENGWWAGEINGQVGYLPATYVKLQPAGSPAQQPPQRMPQQNAQAPQRKPVIKPNSTPTKPTISSKPPSRNPSTPSSRPPIQKASKPVISSKPPTQARPAPVGMKPTGMGTMTLRRSMVVERDVTESDFNELDELLGKLQQDVEELKRLL
eukprot:CAMPEP_0174250066 /NCGR_PEP_ID=MMETSP0439-20130205/357_1 /TAXON_ID=0 /ORGANISM="Stereomyxa ramosa, Strain Chinc5" /LENGTH=183 /DNA_ID=CAMNT_0015330045 /DNA_START=89 /DNA_END=640 /DNA_ORIENTATION=-